MSGHPPDLLPIYPWNQLPEEEALVPKDHPLRDWFTITRAFCYPQNWYARWFRHTRRCARQTRDWLLTHPQTPRPAVLRAQRHRRRLDHLMLDLEWLPAPQASPHLVAWLQLNACEIQPTIYFPEAPLVSTVAVNCRSPSLPRLDRTVRGRPVNAWSYLCRHGWQPRRIKNRVDTGDPYPLGHHHHLHPPLLLHCHWSEVGPWMRQCLRWQLDWLRGKEEPFLEGWPPPEFDDEGGYVESPPWVFWSPLAWQLRAAWRGVLRAIPQERLPILVQQALTRLKRERDVLSRRPTYQKLNRRFPGPLIPGLPDDFADGAGAGAWGDPDTDAGTDLGAIPLRTVTDGGDIDLSWGDALRGLFPAPDRSGGDGPPQGGSVTPADCGPAL